jgi:hypothetical protein
MVSKYPWLCRIQNGITCSCETTCWWCPFWKGHKANAIPLFGYVHQKSLWNVALAYLSS